MAIQFGKGCLRELRFHLCQNSRESAGVRDFIKTFYVDIKRANPDFPILIRECEGVKPCVWARYEKGVERRAPLTNVAADDVLTVVKKLLVK